MAKLSALVLAGLFVVAVAVPSIAMADCPSHGVTASTDSMTTAGTTKTTPVPETKTGG